MMTDKCLIYLLFLCFNIHYICADQCHLLAFCNSVRPDPPVLITRRLAHFSEPASYVQLRCPSSAVSWILTAITGSRSRDQDRRLDDEFVDNVTVSRIGATDLQIRDFNASHEAKYSCEYGLPHVEEVLTCIVVQNIPYFETCEGTSEPTGCSKPENITVATPDQARLDVRVTFRDGGLCENQTIRRMTVTHNDNPIYICANIREARNHTCNSTGKYQIDKLPCSCPPYDHPSQCCKYNFFLTITDFNASDAGRYKVILDLEGFASSPEEMTKLFDLELSPTFVAPPVDGTTTLETTSATVSSPQNTNEPQSAPLNTNALAIGLSIGTLLFILMVAAATIATFIVYLARKSMMSKQHTDKTMDNPTAVVAGEKEVVICHDHVVVPRYQEVTTKEKGCRVSGFVEPPFTLPEERDSKECHV